MNQTAVIEHIQSTAGECKLITGETSHLDHASTILKVATRAADTLCQKAAIGEFKSFCGFDHRGGLLFHRKNDSEDFILVDRCYGWNQVSSDNKTPPEDPVNNFLYQRFGMPTVAEKKHKSYRMLPPNAICKLLSARKDCRLISIRRSSGVWDDNRKKTPSSYRKPINQSFYAFAKILFAQQLPVARFYLEGTEGYLLGWRSLNRTCGFTLWENRDDESYQAQVSALDGLARVFA